MMKLLILLILIQQSFNTPYSISSHRTSIQTMPLGNSFIKDSSIFDYNYNTAYIPIYSDDKGDNNQTLQSEGLIVRVQDMALPPYPFEVLPSKLVLVQILQSESQIDNYGTEDPRVEYRASNKMYYMFYSAVEQKYDLESSSVNSKLALATTQNPNDSKNWKRQGLALIGQNLEIGKNGKKIFRYGDQYKNQLYPQDKINWSKSGAVIFRDELQQYPLLIWGDDYLTMSMAVNNDGFKYQAIVKPFITTRRDYFDSVLVESGPSPIRLSDGNYFFIYNSARKSEKITKKPDWVLEYNAGYLILDYQDPTNIIQRSDEPILSPEMPWEQSDFQYVKIINQNIQEFIIYQKVSFLKFFTYPILTPNVVFIEGMKKLEENKFLVFYGCSDSTIAGAIITVQIKQAGNLKKYEVKSEKIEI